MIRFYVIAHYDYLLKGIIVYYMVFTYSCFNQMIMKQVEEKKRFAASSNSCYNLYEIV